MSDIVVVETLTLDERKRLIFEALNVAVLEVGQQFLDAKREHPGEFIAWVEGELPFSLDTAERYMAITRAFAKAPPEVRDSLPRPYTTLYELTRRPPEHLQAAIMSGTVNPDITHAQARKWARNADPEPLQTHQADNREPRKKPLDADTVAKALLRYPLNEVTEELQMLLRDWLDPVLAEPRSFRRLELLSG